MIAIWVIVSGVLLILWAIHLCEEIGDEWVPIVFAVMSIVFGLLVFNIVLAGFLSLARNFSFYMIVGGVLAIILAFRIRSIGECIGAIS